MFVARRSDWQVPGRRQGRPWSRVYRFPGIGVVHVQEASAEHSAYSASRLTPLAWKGRSRWRRGRTGRRRRRRPARPGATSARWPPGASKTCGWTTPSAERLARAHGLRVVEGSVFGPVPARRTRAGAGSSTATSAPAGTPWPSARGSRPCCVGVRILVELDPPGTPATVGSPGSQAFDLLTPRHRRADGGVELP